MNGVVVTGARGFLGRHVVAALAMRGVPVHAFGRTLPQHGADAATWHRVDLHDRAGTRSALEALRPEGLVHLAWNTIPGAYWDTPENLDWTAATLGLFRDFARCGGRRIVAAGTSAEYDWSAPMPLTEHQSPLAPRGLYGRSKNAVREILEAWAPADGIAWAWGRIFDLFGPGEAPARLVARAARALLGGGTLPMDEGRQRRDFLYVRDAGEAFAALYASAVQGPVNIASGRSVAIRDLLATLERALGLDGAIRFGALPALAGLPEELRASNARLREEVGWSPRYALDAALRETASAARGGSA